MSSLAFLKPFYPISIFPDGTIDQGDRQAATWSYSGVLAGVIVPNIVKMINISISQTKLINVNIET